MIISICGFVLIGLSLLSLALQRFYSCIPSKELKRLAARGDHLAEALYRPVAYGATMRLLLWIVFGLSFAGGALLVSLGFVAPVAFLVIALSVVSVVILQSMRLTVHSARIAVHAAPALNWLLTYLHTPLDILSHGLAKVRTHSPHSGLYEKEDLVALLQQQKEQLDNRITQHDLEILERAVHFDERQAADVLLPMSRVKMVRADDHVGPILLGELHASKQSSFLVFQDSPDQVVGTLFLRDAMQAREGGRVADLVHHKLVYVHEDFSLRQVAQAFTRTSEVMVVVINAFEEALGVITLDRLLTEFVGEAPEDDSIAYEDRAAVASFKPVTPEPETSVTSVDESAAETPVSEVSSPEATEVVE